MNVTGEVGVDAETNEDISVFVTMSVIPAAKKP